MISITTIPQHGRVQDLTKGLVWPTVNYLNATFPPSLWTLGGGGASGDGCGVGHSRDGESIVNCNWAMYRLVEKQHCKHFMIVNIRIS